MTTAKNLISDFSFNPLINNKVVKDKTFNSIGITAFQRFLIPCGHSTPDLKDVECWVNFFQKKWRPMLNLVNSKYNFELTR
jgi:hypothetical protein